MAEAYCVKDKQKVEVAEPAADHHEERQGGPAGHLSDLWRQGLQDRRLTPSVLEPNETALAGDGGGRSMSAAGRTGPLC